MRENHGRQKGKKRKLRKRKSQTILDSGKEDKTQNHYIRGKNERGKDENPEYARKR